MVRKLLKQRSGEGVKEKQKTTMRGDLYQYFSNFNAYESPGGLDKMKILFQ